MPRTGWMVWRIDPAGEGEKRIHLSEAAAKRHVAKLLGEAIAGMRWRVEREDPGAEEAVRTREIIHEVSSLLQRSDVWVAAERWNEHLAEQDIEAGIYAEEIPLG